MNIYTDGACSSKNNSGGWAVVIENSDITISGNAKDTTNNRMELYGVLQALFFIETQEINTYNIYTDSAYIANCFKDKWYKKWQFNGWYTSNNTPVKNRDLWESILRQKTLLEELDYTITINKVKGHDTNYYNNLADKLAVQEREKI